MHPQGTTWQIVGPRELMMMERETDIMATPLARKACESNLTPEQEARLEAIRAKNRTPAARAEEARVREMLDREYRQTGSIATTGEAATMGDLVAFCRFVMGRRRERERLGLSLNDVAERAKIDIAALSRLENGQQLNPTLNTLGRYARGLGKSLMLELSEELSDSQADSRRLLKD